LSQLLRFFSQPFGIGSFCLLNPIEPIASSVCKIFAAKALFEERSDEFAESQKENFAFQIAIGEWGTALVTFPKRKVTAIQARRRRWKRK